jgi:preprotein translocase subunit SecG
MRIINIQIYLAFRSLYRIFAAKLKVKTMYIACIVLIFIASVLLILAVLAQNPKGGMAANFGASNAVMGVRQTTDFLEKSTWGLSIAILLLSLVATMTMPKDRIERSRGGVEDAIMQNAETEGEELDANTLDMPEAMPEEGAEAPAPATEPEAAAE